MLYAQACTLLIWSRLFEHFDHNAAQVSTDMAELRIAPRHPALLAMRAFLDETTDLLGQIEVFRRFASTMKEPNRWLDSFVHGHAAKHDYAAVYEVCR